MMTREEISINFGTNIELERVRLGFSQAKMAKALDMSLSSYKRILTGETSKIDIYTEHQLYQLTNKLGFEFIGDPDPYLAAFHRMRQLSKTQLRTISSFIDFELAFTETMAKGETAEDYITVIVPTGNMADGMIYDSCFTEKLNIASYRKRYGDLIDIGIRITSDHLNPVYQQNDILLVCQRAVRDGDTGIFLDKTTGLIYFRKFFQGHPIRLEPVNGCGKTIQIDCSSREEMNRWISFGYAVTKVRSDENEP